jgi:hypothetical protein
MTNDRRLPGDALAFIQRCVRERKVYWTYHVNMRLAGRHISRDELFEAAESYEIIESYPEDKYLPSYLVWATQRQAPFHVLFAADVDGDNVRIVTAYRPNTDEWDSDLKVRKGRQ